MTLGRTSARGALVAVVLAALTSCAARSPGPQAPVGPEPTTVGEAQADIDRWSAELGIAPQAAPAPGTSGAGPTAAPPAAGADRRTEPQPAAPTAVSQESVQSTTSASASACATPCRAIASMRRSVASLCRLTGEDDPRCVAARRTLDEGERRVARCGC